MNDQDDNRSDKEKALDRLISEADQELSQSFNRPTDECIHTYLTGDATEKQQAKMWAALDASHSFRKEIMEMAEEMEVFASRETAEKAEQLEVKEVPMRILRLVEKKKLTNTLRILAPVAAAALIVLVAVEMMKQSNLFDPVDSAIQVANLKLFAQEVDPGLLISMQPRGANDTASFKVHTAPDSAALAEFRFLLEYEGGEFKFVSEVPQPTANKNTRTVQLKIQDDTGKIIKEFTAVIPISDTTAAPVEAWILNLPDRSLYKVDMSKDTVAVKVDKEQISKGVVTFTYGGDDWFKSTFGFIYNFEEAR